MQNKIYTHTKLYKHLLPNELSDISDTEPMTT